MSGNDDTNLPQLGEMVRDEEIRWTLEPIRPIEDRCVVAALVCWEELANYAYDLQVELRTVRGLMHESLTALAGVTAQLERSKQTVIRLEHLSTGGHAADVIERERMAVETLAANIAEQLRVEYLSNRSRSPQP